MSDPGPVGEAEKRGWRGCFKHVGDWFSYKNKDEWLKEMKGGLSMTASIIATMTFQLATNPPGGVVQANFNETATTITCYGGPCPGYAVMAFVDEVTYRSFLVSNTISFVASLSICLLLISGIPLNHRFPTWLLSIGMCIAITSLAYTYAVAASMVTPGTIFFGTSVHLHKIGLRVWLSLLGIIAVFLTIRLSIWGVKKCRKCSIERP